MFSRIVCGIILILPSLWVIWWTLWHLWNLYGAEAPSSFGMNLSYGQLEILDPWSDVLILSCAGIVTACGVAMLKGVTRKLLVWILGASIMAVVTTGVVGMLLIE